MIPINQKRKKDNTWKAVALYGSLSLNLALMILGGYFLGKLCEERYQWSNMTITGILTGLFFGLYQMFSFAYQATKKK